MGLILFFVRINLFMLNTLKKFAPNHFFLLLLFCGLQNISIAQEDEKVVIPGIYAMPEATTATTSVNSSSVASARADLHKFLGYEILPARYLSTPFDVFIKNNLGNFFIDVGLLLLMLFPILYFFSRTKVENRKSGLADFFMLCLLTLLLVISIPSGFLNQKGLSAPAEGLAYLDSNPQTGTLNNLSDAINRTMLGIYSPIHKLFSSVSGNEDSVTYPLLILLFLGLIFLIWSRIQAHSKATQAVIFFMVMYSFLWWVFGSGAAWYGIVIFSVPYIFLLKGMQNEAQETALSFKNLSPLAGKTGVLLFACVAWLFFAFTFRAANYNPVNKSRAAHIYIPPVIEYQAGNLKKTDLLNMNFPSAVQFEKIINRNEKKKVYRVGTQMNFFVKKNDSRSFPDTFLENFERLVQRYKTKEKVIKALKVSGFEYIVFDLTLANNDRTPEKSLTRKFTNFMNTLYNNPGVELTLTDRTLKMNDSGQVVSGVFPANASIANNGRLAVFRIK